MPRKVASACFPIRGLPLFVAKPARMPRIVASAGLRGRASERSLAKAGVKAVALRHPAQGGARIFAEQLAAFDR
jgi:hypothetical protein